MTTENLKAVLTEAVLTEDERDAFTKLCELNREDGEFASEVNVTNECTISRLADEVVRLRKEVGLLREEWNGGEWEGHEPFDDYYTDALLEISKYKSKTSLVSWYAHMKREKDKCIQELEAQITALKKLDDDNNADSMRRLKQMGEDKRTIKELQAKLKAWEDAEKIKLNKICGFGRCVFCGSTPSTTPGTYHLKPKEADNAQGN